MTDIELIDYLNNEGELFKVKSLDIIRDGGTVLIETSRPTFYIHKKNNTLHTAYPPIQDNLIQSDLLEKFIVSQIQKYISNLEVDLKVKKGILQSILK